MKLYFLRWNPKISMKYEYHLDGMKMLKKNTVSSDWSIYDHEDLEEGDAFIFNQVGTGDNDGIAGFGVFTSDCYAEANWKEKDGTNRFYADFIMYCMLNRLKTSILSAAELEQAIPEIDWHKGHSGVLVPEKTAEKVVLQLMQKTLYLSKPDDAISFTASRRKYPLAPAFARFINGLCPAFKEKIISSSKLTYKNFKEGETVDPMLIDISSAKFNKASLTEGSSLDDIARLFIPVA